MFHQVAVPVSLNQTFTYKAGGELAAGTRVQVPFGPRKVVGVVVGAAATERADSEFVIKRIVEVLDDSPVYSPTLMNLASWMSEYYQHPLGEVLRAMLPASKRKQKTTYVCRESSDESAPENEKMLDTIFGSRKKLLSSTFLRKVKAKEISTDPAKLLRSLSKQGLVSVSKENAEKARRLSGAKKSRNSEDVTAVPELTEPQQRVLQQLSDIHFLDAESEGKPALLFGVTGSGKTEVYLRLIQRLIESESDAQALLMVPEIALTPQMTRVIEERFPGQVAVVHSALTDAERWAQLSMIHSGEVRILVGPRSAVFAPFAKLRLVIVDEEHDNSYKQASGFCYHGRDVAAVRCRFEKAALILGSATPSLESYQNALSGKYHLLELRERVKGRALPEVEIVEHRPAFSMGTKASPGTDVAALENMISKRIISELEENHRAGFQSIVLVNRRGYAHYLFSLSKEEAVKCIHCSISLTLHKRSQKLRCHYCDYQINTERLMAERSDETFLAIGYGSERVEQFLQKKIPGARVQRLDSDTANAQLPLREVLQQFRSGDIDVLVGTQILAKGHDFPNVTLVALVEVDQLLNLPDFRAGERTFQLLVQASGRAGRGENPGRVLLQTMKPNDRLVQLALQHDYISFAQTEVSTRSNHDLPPFRKLISVEINGTDRGRVTQLSDQMANWLEATFSKHADELSQIKVLGPSAPPLEMLRGRHRRNILFAAEKFGPLSKLVRALLQTFAQKTGDLRVLVDVDPQSLL